MSLLEVKLLLNLNLNYNYNKILKCTNIKFSITSSVITNILFIYKILPAICVTMYSCMMEEIRIPIHKQIVQLNIYQI
jgi:hypothetical protein